MSTAEQIIQEALMLPPEARAFVAEQLLESLDISPAEELSPAWREEVRRRCRAMDEGRVQLRDAADVFKDAYGRLA